MITSIVCGNCKDMLRFGTPGAGTEFKLCPKCVISTHKPSKNFTPPPPPEQTTAADGRTRFAVEVELEDLKKRMSQINVELFFKEINDKMHLVISLSDRFGHQLTEFGFSAEKLREFADEINKIVESEPE